MSRPGRFLRDARSRLRDAAYERVRGYPPVSVLQARGLKLGEGVVITSGVWLDPAHCHLISVGDHTRLGPEALILAHDATTKVHLDYTRIDRVTIGARVFVGARAVVLPGVTIGDDAIIGAGSVVSRDVPAGEVWVGNPCRFVMTTEEYVERHRGRIATHPTYTRDWTRRHGLTVERAETMWAQLERTSGYVQ